MKKQKITKLLSNLIIFSVVCIIGALSFVTNTGFLQATTTNSVIFESEENAVYLVFRLLDDDVDDILEILDKKAVKANFLVSGKYASNYSENLVKITDKNHEIINHGYLNRDFSALGYTETCDDIKTAEKVILSACGYKTTIFMPPKAKFNDSTLASCSELGYNLVLYTKNAISDEVEDIREILVSATSGDVIILSTNDVTKCLLGEMIDSYLSKGLQIKTLA